MQIEFWPVSKLVPYFRNPRIHDHAVERMVASITEFGFKIPILARGSGEVVDGHLRLKAAEQMGMIEVPIILCDEWSEAQVKAFRLMANQSATWAEWDLELVAQEIADLKSLDFDLDLTGSNPGEIDDFLFRDPQDLPEEDPVDNPGEPITRRGDLWICGSHRVLAGDATCAEDVARLIGSAIPLLMVTDPPYGVDYDPCWRERAGLGKQRQTGAVTNDDRVDWTSAYGLFPDDVCYVWHAGTHAAEVARGLEASDFQIRAQIIWAKQHFALSRGDYHWQHEPCWYAVRSGRTSNWCGDRTQSTLWQVANLNPFGRTEHEDATGHGTQKPVELMRRPILNHTGRGEIVYDPFLGSGTTLIAAEMTERACFGLDIDPRYVDLVVKRWKNLTGQQAKLAGDGRAFREIAAERCQLWRRCRMPRPKLNPTEQQRRKVKMLSACGTPHEKIAEAMGIRSPKTLRKHYRDELDRGALEANARVASTLFQMATSGEHPAAKQLRPELIGRSSAISSNAILTRSTTAFLPRIRR